MLGDAPGGPKRCSSLTRRWMLSREVWRGSQDALHAETTSWHTAVTVLMDASKSTKEITGIGGISSVVKS